MTPRICLLIFALLCSASVQAQGRLYSDSFESPVVQRQFPLVGGAYQLPAGPTTNQLAWLLGELAAGETTTAAEVNEHFDPSWLNQTPVQNTINFINSVRAAHPNAVITDVIAVTPVRVTVVIDSPGTGAPFGFVSFGARYTGTQKIVLFGSSNYSGSVQFPADQNLSLTQAADKFATLSSAPGLYVGRIRPGGNCEAVVERNPTQLRATASVFKLWVLGGAARAVASNTLTATTPVPMVASKLAPGGVINVEPLGTPFPAGELATMMMGISDNTATDLLHQQVGRAVINQVITDYGVATPTVLTPLLGIIEQFHVFRSFDLPTANSYVNGTEAFQQNFLDTQIVPRANTFGGFFHESLLTAGTWRASPVDICQSLAALRRVAQGSDAFDLVDRAMGAQAAQPEVRNAWDRVWYKGGSLASGTTGTHVLNHVWLLEDSGRDPYVVVAMSNQNTGNLDAFNVQSITGRILQLVAALP